MINKIKSLFQKRKNETENKADVLESSQDYSKPLFVKAAENLNYSKDEINFRFSAFEAMSLHFAGKTEEAKAKLKEMDDHYKKIK